jgi:hypothetical protein
MPDDTTIADDRTTTLPPPYQPKSFGRPHGKAPRWPIPGKSSSHIHGSPYSRNPRILEPKAALAAPPGSLATALPDKRVYDAVKRHRPRFHIIHVILLAGVGAMWLAITQPWGSDAAGAPIYIQQFSIPRISDPAVDIGQLALQTVSGIAIAAVIMAVALLMVNIIYTLLKKLLHRIGLSALAAMLFIPLVALLTLLLLADLALAAGFGGLSFLTQLPFVRDHGFASIGVAHAAIGFYLWWIGIGATLIGALGEIFIDRH